jgi:hypothetical protein
MAKEHGQLDLYAQALGDHGTKDDYLRIAGMSQAFVLLVELSVTSPLSSQGTTSVLATLWRQGDTMPKQAIIARRLNTSLLPIRTITATLTWLLNV